MTTTITTFALLTGLLTGALFAFLKIPIPAPPELPGVMGIIGIYLGYKLIQYVDIGYDVLEVIGI